MQAIEISDGVYTKILSRRVGCEPISETIDSELRPIDDEYRDVDKIVKDCNEAIKNTKKFHHIDEVLR